MPGPTPTPEIITTPETITDPTIALAGAPAMPETPAAPATPVPFLETISEEYRNKPYMKDVTDINGVLKQLDGAQSLIGAPKMPTATSTPEEWNTFYKTLGKPDTAADYAITKDPAASEDTKAFDAAMQEAFHKNNLSKAQAEGIVATFRELTGKIIAGTEASKAKFDADFAATTDKIFGADREGSLAVATKLLDAHAPEAIRTKLSELGPEAMVGLAAVLKGISDKYISSDDIASIKGGTSVGSAATIDQARAELAKAVSSPDLINHFNPAAQAAASANVERLAKIVASFEAKK